MNRLSSLIPRRDRWHAQCRVFFQKCHEPIHIVGLPRLEIAGEQRVRCGISTVNLCHLSLLAVIVLLKRHPSAVQGAVHR